MTRMRTDIKEEQSFAWASQAALRFQIPSEVSLHWFLFIRVNP